MIYSHLAKPTGGGEKPLPAAGATARNTGIDIVRCFAIMCVLCVHFSLNTRFYASEVNSVSMFLQSTFRTLFLMGVPLFLMLTGYLNINKRVERRYYYGCIRVLLSYLFIALIVVAYRIYCLGEVRPWWQWVSRITSFRADPYAWYIAMWIGLFILTPLLNIWWRGLETRRSRQILIATLFCVVCIPIAINRHGSRLIPDYWSEIYPLLYYFMGAYIREYRPRIPKRTLAIIVAAICLVNPVVNALLIHGRPQWLIVSQVCGIGAAILAPTVFMLLYDIEVKSSALKKCFMHVSLLSLDMYLISYIADNTLYPYFMERWYVNQSQFGAFFFVIVPLVFVSSFAFSWIKMRLFRLAGLPT